MIAPALASMAGFRLVAATVAVLLHLVATAHRPQRDLLGPGRGRWTRGQPEQHNLTLKALVDAAQQLQQKAPVKECFAVAKGGELLYDLDYRAQAGKPAPLIESDSAGKTITALLIGVLATKYNLSLDSTLESHGVRPQADWGPGNTYFPHVTIRHVLGQVAGSGKYPPGAEFTYDSDDYLQHLTALIAAVSKQTPKAFAKENFAVPIGIPELYANDSYTAINPADDNNITAGGSQFVNCVQMLRFGQLILNRGVWPNAVGAPHQLISAEYIEQMLTPQHPQAIQNYGLLTWLSTPGPSHSSSSKGGVTAATTSGTTAATVAAQGCCQPQWLCFGTNHKNGGGNISAADGGQWGALLPGETILSTAQLQAAGLPTPRPGLGLALGWLDKHMIVDPFSNTTIVVFGQTLGSTTLCGERYEKGRGWEAGADGAFSASLVWSCVYPLLPSESYSQSARGSLSGGESRSLLDSSTQVVGTRWNSHAPQRRRRMGRAAVAVSGRATSNSSSGGSCVCYCPPQQGFGGCAPAASAAQCSTETVRPRGVCPAIGMVMQCVSGTGGNTTQLGCEAGFDPAMGNCTAFGEQGCTNRGSISSVSSSRSPFDAMRCSCVPLAFEWCGFVDTPCPDYDPFFPLV